MMSNSSSSVQKKQDREALLQTVETLKGELERLQILNERLNGECVYGLSYQELWSLQTQLDQGFLNLDNQIVKVETELFAKDEAEGEGSGIEWTDELLSEKLSGELVFAKRRRNLRKLARELRSSSSSGERLEEHDRNALLQNIEHLKSEIESVQLLNERMSGKELDGLTYFELKILRYEISCGWTDVSEERIRQLQEARTSHLEMLKRLSGQI